MDQIKIGIFLKELRKEKKLTQEQLAEKLNVSGGRYLVGKREAICLISVCWSRWLIFLM